MKMYAPFSLGNNISGLKLNVAIPPHNKFPAISSRRRIVGAVSQPKKKNSMGVAQACASASQPNNNSNGLAQACGQEIKRSIRWFEIELNVREYELDKFGLVNTSVYSSYCQLGHYELLKSIGLSCDFLPPGEALGLIELTMKFHSQLKSGDRFVLKVRISRASGVRFFFEHVMLKLPNLQPIMEANAVAVWLDKNYKPIRPPPDARFKVDQFINDME